MAAAHYYRILGLRTGANFEAVKLAYRNLARLYHPDVNPGDHLAKEKFVQITQAYQAIVDELPAGMAKVSPRATRPTPAAPRVTKPQAAAPTAQATQAQPPGRQPVATSPSKTAPPVPPAPSPGRDAPNPSPAMPPPPGAVGPHAVDSNQDLKQSSFKQLQTLFQAQRYPRAVALVEGLAYRFPNDPEIRQWHAITYYRWGQMSLNHGNRAKAAACLKKAARLDPLNRSLQQSLQQEWRRLLSHRQSPAVSAHG